VLLVGSETGVLSELVGQVWCGVHAHLVGRGLAVRSHTQQLNGAERGVAVLWAAQRLLYKGF
jgi:hypothetical protein